MKRRRPKGWPVAVIVAAWIALVAAMLVSGGVQWTQK